MTAQTLLLTAGLGGCGAVLRFVLLQLTVGLSRRLNFPLGVLLVNMLACFCAGFLAQGGFSLTVYTLLLTGILGGFGTLSSVCSDVIAMVVQKRPYRLTLYLIVMACMCTASAACGLQAGELWHD